MAWHRLRRKGTGEIQIVASLDGVDPEAFDVVPIRANRAPNEFQTVTDDGELITDLERKAKVERDVRARSLSPGALLDRIEALEAAVERLVRAPK